VASAQSTVPLPQSVAYQELRVATRRGRARVHVVTVDPRAPGLVIQPAMGGAVVSAPATTSTVAARLEALAAINGSFYSGYSGLGLPLGLIVIDGRVLSAPLPRRTVFAVDATGRPWIGPVEFSGRLVTDAGAEVPITKYAAQAVANLARQPGYPAGFAAGYDANVVSREDNIKAVLSVADHPKAATADPKEFFDNRFVKELEDTGFVKELYGQR